MDRLISIAWRTFWVGLGASTVLIAQSLIAPPVPTAAETQPILEPAPTPAPPAAGFREAVRTTAHLPGGES